MAAKYLEMEAVMQRMANVQNKLVTNLSILLGEKLNSISKAPYPIPIESFDTMGAFEKALVEEENLHGLTVIKGQQSAAQKCIARRS